MPTGMTITADDVHTWADGFGNWHARVTLTGTGNDRRARRLARRAVADELIERGPRGFTPRFALRLTQRVSRDMRLEYYFEETDPR